jgi:hypothetical protein
MAFLGVVFFMRNSHSRQLFVTMSTLGLWLVVPRLRRAWSFTPTRLIQHRTPAVTLCRHSSAAPDDLRISVMVT